MSETYDVMAICDCHKVTFRAIDVRPPENVTFDDTLVRFEFSLSNGWETHTPNACYPIPAVPA